jgi:hypothetical protein
MPPHLLSGIARVESGRRDPLTGRLHPWPWSINAEGKDSIFETKADAVAFARQLQARGVRSFDTGCLQVNLMFHPNAFRSLEDAFDPLANARYAVRFLTELHDRTGSWETASAQYHSANPELGTPYRGKVVVAMAEEARLAADYGGLPDLAPGAIPSGSPLASMPAGPGKVLMMAAGGGVALRAATAATPAAGAATSNGRSLAAYRLQPVALARPMTVAAK